MNKKIVIFGGRGMLAYDIIRVFQEDFDLFIVDKDAVDITKATVVDTVIQQERPTYIINCAAYTAVDDCEINKDTAMNINGFALKNIASAAKKMGATVIHFSTDYVFDGRKAVGYGETDKKHPLNVYGETKALGEDILLYEYPEKTFIIRTAWLYGKNGKNFVSTILSLAAQQNEIEVVRDQFGSPTYTKDLASAVATLIQDYPPSMYHLVNNGSGSWYDVACEICRIKKLDVRILPIETKQFPRPAKRPQYSILQNTKFPPLRDWRLALSDFLTHEL